MGSNPTCSIFSLTTFIPRLFFHDFMVIYGPNRRLERVLRCQLVGGSWRRGGGTRVVAEGTHELRGGIFLLEGAWSIRIAKRTVTGFVIRGHGSTSISSLAVEETGCACRAPRRCFRLAAQLLNNIQYTTRIPLPESRTTRYKSHTSVRSGTNVAQKSCGRCY